MDLECGGVRRVQVWSRECDQGRVNVRMMNGVRVRMMNMKRRATETSEST